MLGLPGIVRLRQLDPHVRVALRAILIELADDARARGDESWLRHKAPMAAYWKAVAVYAGHVARAAMIYDERIATISRAEFEELMATVRALQPAKHLTDEDRWRRRYQAEQEQRRVVGYQQDLFAAKPITHFHRHRPAPSWDRPPEEPIAAKLERIAGDPLATFGPGRNDRPAYLDPGEKAAIIAKAANWLRVGQRVRLIDAPGTVDPAFGIQRFLGRYGVVWRLCRSFEDHCYIFFDPVGGERTAKIEFVEVRDLAPVR